MPQQIKRILEPEEIFRLYQEIENEIHLMLLKTTLKHGLRNSEAVNLKKDHIDFGTDELLVYLGKGDKDRKIPIPNNFRDELKEYVEALETEYLFPNGRGSHYSTRYFEKLMDKYCVKAGLYPDNVTIDNIREKIPKKRRITPHSLRHTYATQIYKKGVDLKKIQKLLGHSELATTADIYSHLSVEDVRDAVNKLPY